MSAPAINPTAVPAAIQVSVPSLSSRVRARAIRRSSWLAGVLASGYFEGSPIARRTASVSHLARRGAALRHSSLVNDLRLMFAPSAASRPDATPVRWRLVLGWGAFFVLVVAGLVLFWVFLDGSPMMHDVSGDR